MNASRLLTWLAVLPNTPHVVPANELGFGDRKDWRNIADTVAHLGYVENEWMNVHGHMQEYTSITPSGRSRVDFLIYDGQCRVLGHDLGNSPALAKALHGLYDYLITVTEDIQRAVGDLHDLPPRFVGLRETARELAEEIDAHKVLHRIEYNFISEVVAIASRRCRINIRNRLERLDAIGTTPDLGAGARLDLDQIHEILDWPEVAVHRSAQIPRVTDIVNVGRAQSSLSWDRNPGTFVPDEKFEILSEPKSFARDYDWAREQAFARQRSLAVAYVDIDHFKKINTEHTETWVDRKVLPPFMRALEAYCFSRAYAYREGGDEYIILMPNADDTDAQHFFEGLRHHSEQLRFEADVKLTVSVGFHVVSADAELTMLEAKQLANSAKNRAKRQRNSVEPTTPEELAKTLGYPASKLGEGADVFGTKAG